MINILWNRLVTSPHSSHLSAVFTISLARHSWGVHRCRRQKWSVFLRMELYFHVVFDVFVCLWLFNVHYSSIMDPLCAWMSATQWAKWSGWLLCLIQSALVLLFIVAIVFDWAEYCTFLVCGFNVKYVFPVGSWSHGQKSQWNGHVVMMGTITCVFMCFNMTNYVGHTWFFFFIFLFPNIICWLNNEQGRFIYNHNLEKRQPMFYK